MKTYHHTVVNELGMHARPAGMFVKLAKQYHSKIQITKGDRSADAIRILAVMGMGIRQGDEITLTVDGPDEETVMAEVEKICKEIL